MLHQPAITKQYMHTHVHSVPLDLLLLPGFFSLCACCTSIHARNHCWMDVLSLSRRATQLPCLQVKMATMVASDSSSLRGSTSITRRRCVDKFVSLSVHVKFHHLSLPFTTSICSCDLYCHFLSASHAHTRVHTCTHMLIHYTQNYTHICSIHAPYTHTCKQIYTRAHTRT